MNLNDDVVYRCLRLGPLHQLHPGRSRSLVRYHDRLHVNCLLGYLSLAGYIPHPPDDLTQLGTIGLDKDVNRQAIDGLGAAGVDLSPG
jgi:hypothetical protein